MRLSLTLDAVALISWLGSWSCGELKQLTIELDLVFDASLLVMDMAARDGAMVLSNMEALHLAMFPERISHEPAR